MAVNNAIEGARPVRVWKWSKARLIDRVMGAIAASPDAVFRVPAGRQAAAAAAAARDAAAEEARIRAERASLRAAAAARVIRLRQRMAEKARRDRARVEARRLDEIVAALAAEFPDANADTLRELAVHRLALQAQQQAAILGVAKASTRVVRHSNVILRIERGLRRAQARRAKRPGGSDLAAYLAGYGSPAGGGSGDGA
jgi:hypothetical protein